MHYYACLKIDRRIQKISRRMRFARMMNNEALCRDLRILLLKRLTTNDKIQPWPPKMNLSTRWWLSPLPIHIGDRTRGMTFPAAALVVERVRKGSVSDDGENVWCGQFGYSQSTHLVLLWSANARYGQTLGAFDGVWQTVAEFNPIEVCQFSKVEGPWESVRLDLQKEESVRG